MHIMAGVLEQIMRPRKQLVRDNASAAKIDQKVMELQGAMEILAEVFDTDVSDIDMMLRQRYEMRAERPQRSYRRAGQQQPFLEQGCEKTGEWPREFCLAE
jgi:L-rhamnose isomerase